MSAWSSQPLSQQHDVTRFRCANESLDRWLPAEALRAHRAGVARTTAWVTPDDPTVVAYHAIAPTQIARVDLPGRSLSGGYTRVPGYLIGRLALDESLHGQGLGSQLLLDAVERIVEAADRAGGRVIAVDAIDTDAHDFYVHHGFQPVAGSDRLVMKLATARAALP